MSEVNLSDLPIEVSSDIPQIDFDNYVDPSEYPPPVVDGTYTFKTTEAKLDYKSVEEMQKQVRQTRELKVMFTHEAYDSTGAKAGVVAFDRVSTHIFNRGNPPIPASTAADQIRACGITTRPTTLNEWGENLLSIKSWCDQGNTWAGVVRVEGFCAHTDTQFESQKGPDGKYLDKTKQVAPHKEPFAPRGAKNWEVAGAVNGTPARHDWEGLQCPICGKDVRAQARINRRIPK